MPELNIMSMISLRNIKNLFNLKNSQIESRTISSFGEEWTRYDQKKLSREELKIFLMIILIFFQKNY